MMTGGEILTGGAREKDELHSIITFLYPLTLMSKGEKTTVKQIKFKDLFARGSNNLSNVFYDMLPSMPKGEIDGNIMLALMST